MYVEELFGLFQKNGDVVAISDNKDILKWHKDKTNDIKPLEENLDRSDYFCYNRVPENVDIVENDVDKEYGLTEISYINGAWDVLMHQPRMLLKNSFKAACESISEANKSYIATEPTLNKAVAQHCDFWMRPADARRFEKEVAMPTVFYLSDDMKVLLLKTGFTADMILFGG